MIVVAILFVLGLSLSAFFSGSETGFYRVTRVRLMLDAIGGDRIARALLWLTNNPALFVATTLVGNNVANYMVSLSIVLGIGRVFGGDHDLVELFGTVALSPVLFVYGELLPKNLFYQAPNALLRRGGPLFLLFVVLFAPASALLWALGRISQGLIGETPLRVQLTLARKELQQVLEEGHEFGILQPTQRTLAQGLFAVGAQPITDFAVPVARVATVRRGTRTADVLRLARRQGVPVVPVTESHGRGLTGYVRVIDLHLSGEATVETVRPLMKIRESETHITALIRMQTRREDLAVVTDSRGEAMGVIYASDLLEPLLATK